MRSPENGFALRATNGVDTFASSGAASTTCARYESVSTDRYFLCVRGIPRNCVAIKRMELVFDGNTPVNSKLQRSASIPLSEIRSKSVTVNVLDREKYAKDALFTLVTQDLSARGGSYLHEVTINADRDKLMGESVLPYIPPDRDGHQYRYLLYLQPYAIDVSGDQDRRSFDVDGIVNDVNMRLIGEIVVSVPLMNKGRGRAASLSPPPRQIPSVRAGARSRYSMTSDKMVPPARYATMLDNSPARSQVLPASRYPGNYSDVRMGRSSVRSPHHSTLNTLPLSELLNKADVSGVYVRDRTSRNSAVNSLEQAGY